MSFYKMQSGQTEFLFQLANLEIREDFALWDNNKKGYIRQVEGVNDINDLKFMRYELFTQKYPHLAKRSSFNRDIIINQGGINTLYTFGFHFKDNQQLVQEISNILNLQHKNPLMFNFKYRRTGEGLATIRVVVAMNEVGLPQNVQQSSASFQDTPINKPFLAQNSTNAQQELQRDIQPQNVPKTAPNAVTEASKPKIQFGIPNEQKIVALNQDESEIYSAACEYTQEGKLSEDRFVQLWNECARSYFGALWEVQRVKDIYKELYSKLK